MMLNLPPHVTVFFCTDKRAKQKKKTLICPVSMVTEALGGYSVFPHLSVFYVMSAVKSRVGIPASNYDYYVTDVCVE
jgi:hypothetical protein